MTFSAIMWILILFPLGYSLGGALHQARLCRLFAACLVPTITLVLPVNGTTILAYIGSVLYEPSIALVLTCFLTAFGSRFSVWFHEFSTALLRLRLAFALSGLTLYPMALGLGYFDPYGLGYQSPLALAAALVSCAMWIMRRHMLIAIWLTCSLAAHRFNIGESDNLFDYLVDPIAVAIAVMSLFWGRIANWRMHHAAN
ncbi:MAG: hypothetical protein OXE85_02725 [Roseovarius sp.]|nr:hypothetical protein [Roseovarius sp.]